MERWLAVAGVFCCLALCAGTAAGTQATGAQNESGAIDTAAPPDAGIDAPPGVDPGGTSATTDSGVLDPVRLTDDTGTEGALSPSATPTIQGESLLDRTPGTIGKIDVTYEATLPDNVVDFYVYLNSSLSVPFSVTATNGFSYDASNGRWAASSPRGSTTTVSLTYAVEANTTSSFGGFDTVETADWALVGLSQLGLRQSWRYYSPAPNYAETTTVDGPGYGTDGRAFLGPVSTSQQSTPGQSITLVTPDAATPDRSPSAVLDDLATVSEVLRVGDRDPQMTAFIAPEPIRGGGRGGGSSFWVQENSLTTIPVHEYIHTRQAWLDGDLPADDDSTVEWLTEASADYYEGYLAWDLLDIFTAQEFYSYASTSRYENAVLQDSNSNAGESKNYEKGRRVLTALDIRIRQHTNNGQNLTTIFERLNGKDGTFSYSDFRSEAVALTNQSTASWLDTYVTTSAAPTIPQDIAAAYNPAVSDLSGLDIAGQGTSATLTQGASESVGVTVTNAGSESASFTVALQVGGIQQTQSTATLAAGETETVTFTGVTDGLAVGSYDVTVSTANGTATVSGTLSVSVDVAGSGSPARDADGDGLYEDVRGEGDGATMLDVQTLFSNLDSPAIQDNAAAFTFQGDDDEVGMLDVQALYDTEVAG
jgi:hypothetical protein